MFIRQWCLSLLKRAHYSLHQIISNGASKENNFVNQSWRTISNKTINCNLMVQLLKRLLFSQGIIQRKLIKVLSVKFNQEKKEQYLKMIKILCNSIQILRSKNLHRSQRSLQLLRKILLNRGLSQQARALVNRSKKEKSPINKFKRPKSTCRRLC